MNNFDSFVLLPEKIKSWLSSMEVIDALTDINFDLGLTEKKEEEILGMTILKLITQDLDPRHFVNELGKQLKVNHEAAKKIAERIKEEVLSPIEVELKNIGTDPHQIIDYAEPPLKELEKYTDKPEARSQKLEEEKTTTMRSLSADGRIPPSLHGATERHGEMTGEVGPKVIAEVTSSQDSGYSPEANSGMTKELAEVATVGFESRPEKVAPKILGSPTSEGSRTSGGKTPDNLPIKPRPMAGKPFILHEEKEAAEAVAGSGKPTFAYRAPMTEQEVKKPVRAEVEGAMEVKRVVHYSNFLTHLSQANVPNKVRVPRSKWFKV